MSHIFISYSREDMNRAGSILPDLITRLQRNFNIWLDKISIIPGDNWQDALRTAVKNSSAVVYFVSPVSAHSEWCLEEIETAHIAKIPIIPYLLDGKELPFGLKRTHAIFPAEYPDPHAHLEKAIRAQAPDAYIHGEPLLITKNLLNNRAIKFHEAAAQLPNSLTIIAEDADGNEIRLIGLPLTASAFCTSYIVGRADDNLGWQSRIQLSLQFTGNFGDAGFAADIASYLFKKHGPNFPLRLLLVRGPAQMNYIENQHKYNLIHGLEIPTGDVNQWSDALYAIDKTLRFYHEGRNDPDLQIFVQGPVAGLTYEMGVAHRGLHYRVEHYHFDRATKSYYRVLGNLDTK